MHLYISFLGNTMAFLFYCLSTNIEAQEKLRAEVHQFDGELTEKSIGRMKYLRACLKESQRMFPLLAFFTRICPENFVLEGYQIPAPTSLMWVPELLSKQHFNEPHR